MTVKTQRLEIGLLLIMRAVGSETAPGGVLETKPNCRSIVLLEKPCGQHREGDAW